MQGASWGLVIVGAYLFFSFFLPFGLFVALTGAFFGASIGLFLVIFFEMAHLKLLIYREKKEHTRLLTQIVRLLENRQHNHSDEKLSDH